MEGLHGDRMQHLDEGTIHAWLDGALSPDEGAAVEQHAQHCAECASLVAEARGMIAGAARIVGALDIVPGGVIPKQRGVAPGRSIWRSLHLTPFRAALAASLMIAAASLTVIRRSDRYASPDARPAESVVIAPSAAPGAPRVAVDSVAAVGTAPMAKTASSRKPSVPVVADMSRTRADSAPARTLSEAVTTSSVAPKAEAPRASAQAQSAAATPPPAAAAPPVVVAEDRAVTSGARGGGRGGRGGAVNADKRLAPATPTMDTLMSAPAQRSVVGGVSGRVMNASDLLMTSNEAMNFVGCYEVERDSGVVFGALPQRFALDRQLTTNPPRNVVFGIDSFNRRDSTVVGMWRDVDRSSVMVTLASGTRDSIRFSPATRQPSQARSQPQSAMRFASRPLRIFRMTCPP